MNYQKEYQQKLVTAEEAVKCIRSGDRVDYSFMTTKPIACDAALAARHAELSNVEVYAAITVLPVPEVVKHPDTFIYHDLHFSKISRIIQRDFNLCYYFPIMYHEAGKWFRDNIAKQHHVFIAQVCPMDEHGYFNFSLTNSVSLANAHHCEKVILEINPNLPVALGGFEESIHISDVDYIVEVKEDMPVFEAPAADPTEVDRQIAEHVMGFIHDGCCIQLGIGGMPDAVGKMIATSDLKNLGGHTEMLSEAYVDMIESGRMTGIHKPFDKCRVPYTFALGPKRLYDFINNNPAVASYPAQYTNDPRRIAQIDNFISINNAVEVDLYTQVNAESADIHQISGNGGMWDFVMGAQWSKGGKSLICLASTATNKEGERISRIVPHFDPCSITTIPRQQVDTIVTEYGAAEVRARSTWERAEMMVNIAHPDFRDELVKKAEAQKIWKRSNKKDA
ncbi:4-hydroxybutyrate CoA-transferase [Desulfobotulus sp. H1]|uniref:Probable butyrate:acetyl-CoA coenzyme A-transferase n=1 Tax=Desulfobotulus pelophilus TaxID=2823377 RepID=A0ABT3N8S1_9BACT|nr:acetyl-CoA hydrolase/transferase C-terminal domain-containing protein [Desulfobotulus pelophilus]MCW7753839.1 4-hydroxybutyrate CoA-transferase [Desulfobotulus pelophilus]